MIKNNKGVTTNNLLTIILVVITLAIGLYFIFEEFANEEDLNFETCRQSILLRGAAPAADLGPTEAISFKKEFPLKCKTNAVTITEEMLRTGENFPSTITGAAITPTGEETEQQTDTLGTKRAEQLIARTIAECWGLFGEGDQHLFPAAVFGTKSYCVPCARIHLTQKAKEYLTEEGISLNIEEALRRGEEDSFLEYLQNSGDQFPAFGFGGASEYKLDNKGFDCACGEGYRKQGTIRNKQTGRTKSNYNLGELWLPQRLNPEHGDLLIMYGSLTISGGSDIGPHIPYLFYFQTEQPPYEYWDEIEQHVYYPWKETDDEFLDSTFFSAKLCEHFEGIPG